MFSDLKLFYKSCNGLVPISLPDYVVIRNNTRSSSGDAIMYGIEPSYFSSQKSVFTHTFFPRCISHWNALPVNVRTAYTYTDFIYKLEGHIWESISAYIRDIEPEPD